MPSATRRYQSAMLGARQSKHEVLWEAPNVAFDRLIEPTSAHSVDSCEFAIENHSMAPKDNNRSSDLVS
jgi:hypothetical protein